MKKIFKRVKKEDPIWKKIRWGLIAAMLVLTLGLSMNVDFRAWLFYAKELGGKYEKLRLVWIYLAIIKHSKWAVKIETKGRTEVARSKGYELTEDEKFVIYVEAVGGGIIMALIATLAEAGLMIFFIFLGVVAFACIFAKPITFIVKK